jgi:hypothetical protein
LKIKANSFTNIATLGSFYSAVAEDLRLLARQPASLGNTVLGV